MDPFFLGEGGLETLPAPRVEIGYILDELWRCNNDVSLLAVLDEQDSVPGVRFYQLSMRCCEAHPIPICYSILNIHSNSQFQYIEKNLKKGL